MKKRKNIWVNQLVLFMLSLCFITCCKKNEDNNPINLTNGKTTASFNPDLSYGTMTDQDDNVYRTITIGTQTWMAENLRTTRFRNGNAIPIIKSYSTI